MFEYVLNVSKEFIMKKLIRIGLLSVVLLTTVVANASEKLNVRVASKASKVLSISLAEVTKGETLYIRDNEGVILFSEELEKVDKFKKVFNFSELPAGLYFVETKEKEQSTPVLISNKNVALIVNFTKIYKAPTITIKDNVMNVLINNASHSDVPIDVYNQDGLLLNNSNHNTNVIVLGCFDISTLSDKKLIVSVSEGDYNFVQEIEL